MYGGEFMLENLESKEKNIEEFLNSKDFKDIPKYMTELGSDEGIKSIKDIANLVYEKEVLTSPGLISEWKSICGKSFVDAFNSYVKDGSILLKQYPQQYNFFKERLFYGKEFIKEVKFYDYINETAKALHDIPQLKMNVWEKLTTTERAAVLSETTKRVADILKVPVHDVDYFNSSSEKRGYYNGDGYIHLNSDVLTNPKNFYDALDTILHESRHAFQRLACSNCNVFGVNLNILEQWRTNFKYYISPELDYQLYYNQPVEVDARKYAESVIYTYKS